MIEMGTTPKQRQRYFQSFPEIFISNKQAFEKGIATEITPIPAVCEFCGEEILTWGFMGTEIPGQDVGIVWNPLPERCTCYQAEKYWYEFDKLSNEEKEKEKREREQKAKRDELNRLLQQSRLVDAFGGKTFEEFNLEGRNKSTVIAKTKSENFAKSFEKAEETGKGLLFSGPCGTGKTHLAAATALEICKQRKTVIAIDSVELLARLRSSYNRESHETEQQILAVFITVDLLFIDDLGKEKPSDWTLEKLFWILDQRCKKKKPVLVTLNYSDQELIDRLARKNNIGYELDVNTAKSIVSRLHEMTWPITINDSDYRRQM